MKLRIEQGMRHSKYFFDYICLLSRAGRRNGLKMLVAEKRGRPAMRAVPRGGCHAQSKWIQLIPKKILVPIDFSASSEAALKQASALAEQLHAEIHLVHVIPMFTATKMPDFIPEAEFIGEAKKAAERHFESTKAELGRKGNQGELKRRNRQRCGREHTGCD